VGGSIAKEKRSLKEGILGRASWERGRVAEIAIRE